MVRLREHAAVILFYVVMTLAMTWPVAMHMTSYVAGVGGDPWQTMWRFETKQEGGFSEFLYDITGSGSPRLVNLSVWPWMPLQVVFGQPLSYNLVWLLSFILSGYAMYLLVECLTKSGSKKENNEKLAPSLPALLAGLYYMFLPYHVAHSMGHFGAMQLQWIPLIFLTTLLWFKKPTLQKSVVLVLLMTVQAWSEHHYMLWLVLVLIASALYWRKMLVEQVRHSKSLYLNQAAIVLVLVVLGVVVPYTPTIKLAFQSDTHLELGQDQLIRFSADLFSYITPAPFHTFWGGFADSLFASSFTGNASEATQYVGITALLLVVFFYSGIRDSAKRYWLMLLVLFAVISLGPKLHIFGEVLSVPLPYALIDSWPVISSVRAVARAGSIVGLAGAVLLGYTLASQIKRRGAAVFVASIILVEFLFLPTGGQSAILSPAYNEVEAAEGARVVEVPAATNYTIASRALYATTTHGKEVIGNIALERAQSADDFEEAKQLPGIRQLLYLRTTELHENRPEFLNQGLAETLPDAMKSIDAASIVVHRDSLSHYQFVVLQSFLEDALGLSVKPYNDVLVYSIQDATVKSDGVFASRLGGWENIGFDPVRQSVFAEIPEEAELLFTNVDTQNKEISLSLILAPESEADIEIIVDGEKLNRPIFTLPPGQLPVRVRRVGEGSAIIIDPKFTAQ